MRYSKQPEDEQFRIVSLMVSKEPEYQPFDSDSIVYAEQKVLEILRTDGSTILEYGDSPIPIMVNSKNNRLYFKSDIPTARVWLRPAENKNGIYYKVPSDLRVDSNYQWVLIPAGVQGYELCADKTIM